MDQFKKAWKQGINSFESDPPNAALTASGRKAQIIMLKGMIVNPESVSFQISLVNRTVGLLKIGR